MEVDGGKACFPKIGAFGDSSWDARRSAKEDEARLWKKVEWFAPLWLPMDKIHEMLAAFRNSTNERAVELFEYHTSTLYTLAFKAVCIAQIMPLARSLQEIVPLAREAYLGFYSGYKASSIAALIPAIEGGLTRIVADLSPDAHAPDKIDHAVNRAIRTAADIHFEGMWFRANTKPSTIFLDRTNVYLPLRPFAVGSRTSSSAYRLISGADKA